MVGGMTTLWQHSPTACGRCRWWTWYVSDAPAAAASVKDGARFDDLTNTWGCVSGASRGPGPESSELHVKYKSLKGAS